MIAIEGVSALISTSSDMKDVDALFVQLRELADDDRVVEENSEFWLGVRELAEEVALGSVAPHDAILRIIVDACGMRNEMAALVYMIESLAHGADTENAGSNAVQWFCLQFPDEASGYTVADSIFGPLMAIFNMFSELSGTSGGVVEQAEQALGLGGD